MYHCDAGEDVQKKNDVLKALGATIIRTPTSAAFDAPNSHISEAQRIMERLNAEKPGSAHILDQYTNAYNPIAHYDATAEEILGQLNNKVDMLVATAGTGGTICGLARKIKEKCPECVVVGVDPAGSILALPDKLNNTDGSGFYEVEGIGYDFIPTVLDRAQIDVWYKSVDKPSFNMSRQLIKREGFLCGGSSGSAVYCAVEAIARYNMLEGKNVVVLLPDSIRNYMTKFLSDEWMVARDFLELSTNQQQDTWWSQTRISEIKERISVENHTFTDSSLTCSQALERMRSTGTDSLFFFKPQDGTLSNVITKKSIMAKLVNGSLKPSDSVLGASLDRFILLKSSDSLKRLQCSLDSEGYAFVLNESATNTAQPKKDDFFGVVNVDMFLSYISSH